MFSLRPIDVFTPRAGTVNSQMYIQREFLEGEVKRCLDGTKHFLIHGESGNGKTWLWKRVFEKQRVTFTTINMGRAIALNSVRAALFEKIDREVPQVETEVKYEGIAGVKPYGIGVEGKKTKTIVSLRGDPFYDLIARFKGIKTKHSVIVFENFDQIASNDDLVREFASYLILLDDDDYSKFHCRICIVGVPGNLKELFSKLAFADTISSRINEVAEVARMTKAEAEELLERGFKLLRLRFRDDPSRGRILKRLTWVSDRNADQLQELGLRVATISKENEGVIENRLVDEVVNDWIQMQHAVACAAVESKMSPADTMFGRRNQILYCIGQIESHEFGVLDVRKMIEKVFGDRSVWIASDFDRIFLGFCEGFDSILKPSSHLGSYQVRKVVYRMAIRALLKLEEGGGIAKVGRSI